jgi:hypothetical protein
MPGGTYFAEYDWTCRNQVGYLNGSVCDLKFFIKWLVLYLYFVINTERSRTIQRINAK